ncbi:MAG: DUF1385 domain-containing protein [Fretibacterium sp.]|nr:DUF1385 domain-containing protein [Fretibacterium sp.]
MKHGLLNFFALAAGLFADEAGRIPVGGQAVIEGVLMKGEGRWGLAVRRPGGDVFREHWPNSSRTRRLPWKLPLLRGMVIMCEMMATGFRALSRSAEIALEEEEEEMTFRDTVLTVVVAVLAVGGLFIALPLWAAGLGARLWDLSPLWTNVLEGCVRAAIFVGYIAVIGMWPDIQQVFRYHGAEHKTINAFEGGLEMTPENILTCSRIHPRCGTSFLLIAVIVSIAVFSPIKTVIASAGGGFWSQVGARVLLIPVVIGISYEIIRLASKGIVGRVLISPLLSLQYLTTREPDLGQAEVALISLNVALNKED